jgi:negative regulator of replication initiation
MPAWFKHASFLPSILHASYEDGRQLSDGELALRQIVTDRLHLATHERAAYWKQRAKFRALREDGDEKCSVRLRLNKIRQLDYDTAHADKLSALTRFLQMQTGLFRWNNPTTAGPLRSLPGSSAQRPCSSRSLLLKHGMQSKTRTRNIKNGRV